MQRTKKFLPTSFSFSSQLRISSNAQSTTTTAVWSSSALIRAFSQNRTESKDPEPLRERSISKDALILEQFKARRQRASFNADQQQTKLMASTSIGGSEQYSEGRDAEAEVVSGFEGLGLREELIGAVEEMGLGIPSEIQCVGIPAVLDDKCVILCSEPGPSRTLAYLLPLVQLLRQSEGTRHGYPRAIVLCAEEEQSHEFFHMAKFIIDHCRKKSKSPQDSSKAAIDMLIGTPDKILEHVEEGDVACDDIKFLVLDGADAMLYLGFGPKLLELLKRLRDQTELQTIIVTSPVTEMIGKQVSGALDHLERSHAGTVAAMMLQIDRWEVLNLVASADGIAKKVAEAIELSSC